MATGDLTIFNALSETIGQELHDFSNDVLRAGIVTGVTPSQNEASPTWATYSANEITTGTSYASGGPAVTSTWVRSGGTTTLACESETIEKDVSGQSSATCWAILYNFSSTAKNAIAFIELGTIDLTISNVVLKFQSKPDGESGTVLTVYLVN